MGMIFSKPTAKAVRGRPCGLVSDSAVNLFKSISRGLIKLSYTRPTSDYSFNFINDKHVMYQAGIRDGMNVGLVRFFDACS